MDKLHDLYMEMDVLFLADIYENFSEFSMTNYGLDPAHFTTAPGLSWTAALKYTDVQLEIPKDCLLKPTIQKLKGMTLKNKLSISS